AVQPEAAVQPAETDCSSTSTTPDVAIASGVLRVACADNNSALSVGKLGCWVTAAAIAHSGCSACSSAAAAGGARAGSAGAVSMAAKGADAVSACGGFVTLVAACACATCGCATCG